MHKIVDFLKIRPEMTYKQTRNRVEFYVFIGYIIYLLAFLGLWSVFH